MSEQKLYIGNLPYRATESDLRKYLRDYGPIYSLILIYDDDTGRTRGYGFVELEESAAEAALYDLNDTMFMGRNLKIHKAIGKDSRDSGQNQQRRYAPETIADRFGYGDTAICGVDSRKFSGKFGDYGDFTQDDFKGLNIYGKYYKIESDEHGLYHAYRSKGSQLQYSGPSNAGPAAQT